MVRLRSCFLRCGVAPLFLLCSASLDPVEAQFALAAGAAAGEPGDAVTVGVTLDNDDLVRGFSFGLTHDGALLAVTAADQGAAVLDANGGAGADYWFTELDPVGGPGAIVACILTLSAPLEDLPIATENEIAVLSYDIDALAAPDTTAALDFSDDLGSPAVVTVVSVAGVSYFPTVTSGSVTVLPPPPIGLACTTSDACLCTFSITWTNGATYDSIEIRADGVLVETLLGNATSTTRTTTVGVPVELSVTGVVGASDSAAVACTLSCVDVPSPAPPTGLSCSVDDVACEVTLSWTNARDYGAIELTLDGSLAASLAGTATSGTVALADVLAHEICVIAYNSCDEPATDVCCTVQCTPPPEFRRGDDNNDGARDISDPVFALNYLFGDGIAYCIDAMDVNDSGLADIADPVYNLNFIFAMGPEPPAPYPDCGTDDTSDSSGCDTYDECP